MTAQQIGPGLVRTFMTHDMPDADILALSTGREPEFRRVIDAVARSREAVPGTLQHAVVYGSRGFGKSFLMRRVEIALAGSEGEPLRAVLLPEEQHNLYDRPHALLDTIARRIEDIATGRDNAFSEGHYLWPRRDDEARLWREKEAAVEAALDRALPGGRGLAVVILENFDILLATLFRDSIDEQRLRAWLDRPGNRVMLLATATGSVDMDYDRPLFQAFETIRLPPWSSDECIAYFNRLRAHEERPPLTPDQEAKARAIAEFIGGTPRIARLLAEVLDTEEADTVADTMTALADRLAEYYRRRIEDLPPRARGLLDALIRGGEPASQTELAERVGAGGQSDIAQAMAELQRAGILRGTRAPKGRATLYRVTDRVFAHYFRLRQGNREVRHTPLATILDFLKSFYSWDEQRREALRHLDAGRLPEAGLFGRLALGAGSEVIDDLLSLPAEELYHRCVDGPDSGISKAIRTTLCAWAAQRMGQIDRARDLLRKALQEASDDPATRSVIGAEYSRFLSHIEDADPAAAETSLHRRGLDDSSRPVARDAGDMAGPAIDLIEAALSTHRMDPSLLFEKALEAWRLDPRDAVPPSLLLADLSVVAAIAGDREAFSALLERNRAVLNKLDSNVRYTPRHGEAFAGMAETGGRAMAEEALAWLLPWIAVLMDDLPEAIRDPDWLPSLLSGFAGDCRDPGLLRDVAALLTADLAPAAPNAAVLLGALADVDEAAAPETVLAHLDPDVATFIRRLRDLPEPEPAGPARKAGRRAKLRS